MARTTHFALHRALLNQDKINTPTTKKLKTPRRVLFDVEGVWLAAMVPKRWAKRAVTRNTIRRQINSVSMDFELALSDAAHVVRLRSGFDRADFPSATSEKLKAVVRLELQLLFSLAVSPSARPKAEQSSA